MLQSAQYQITNTEDMQWTNLCRICGVASLLQLGCVLITVLATVILGAEPATAAEYFTFFQNDRLVALIRLDFATLLLLCLLPFTSFSIYAALRCSSKPYAALATTLIFVCIILALADHSAFSMIRISDQYAAVTGGTQQEQLLAAGEAVIVSNMWNSTAGFLAGIFIQGAFVFISVVMLRGKGFSKGTAYTGILANGLDLENVLSSPPRWRLPCCLWAACFT
jgi:hypothetical protein